MNYLLEKDRYFLVGVKKKWGKKQIFLQTKDLLSSPCVQDDSHFFNIQTNHFLNSYSDF